MRTTTRYEAALRAAHEAAQWAGITAYARQDGSFVTIKEEHQNGEWVYTATHVVPATGFYESTSESATFTCRTRPKPLGLKQLAGRALNG